MSGRSIVIVLVLAVGLLVARGQAQADVSISARVDPSVVAVGNEATLVITIRGKFRKTAQPQLPPLDEFEVYQSGTSQSFSIVNGRRQVLLAFTYVLVAKKEGRYTIEPIRFQTGGNIYTADPITIEVVQAASQLPAPSSPAADDLDSEDGAPIFIRAAVDRDTVYVNQQITWTLGFYTDGRIDLLRSPEYSPPSSEGFWVEDMAPQKNYYSMIGDKKYLVNEILRAFFPAAPGEYTIGAAEIEIVLDDFAGRTAFDDFFNLRRRRLGFGKARRLSTDPIQVTVLPLPRQGRPGNFSGLVGRELQMSLTTDRTAVRAGEPVNVTLEITGEGNFKTMAAPEIADIRGFKMYESGSSSELFKSNYVVSGRKITNFVLIPRDEGEAVIPPIELSYFDPYNRRYHTIQSQPLRLQVSPGAQGEGGTQVVFTGSGEDIEVLGRDIHHIHPVPAQLTPAGAPFYRRGVFLALNSLPLLVVALSLVVQRRRQRWSNDVPRARARRALRAADRRLAAAEELMRKGHSEEVFAGVSAAIRNYLADKMNASAPGLTEQDIGTFLEAQQVSAEERRRVHSLLAECDGARYSAAAASTRAAEKTLRDARVLIKALETSVPA